MRIELSKDALMIHNIMIQAFDMYKDDNVPSSALDETVETIEQGINNDEYAFIGYHNDIAVAMVRFKITNDQLYFYRLSVLPDYQGRGFAKKLLNTLEDYGRKHHLNQIACTVRLNISKNIYLYESTGYTITKKFVRVEPNNKKLDIVLMTKSLNVF